MMYCLNVLRGKLHMDLQIGKFELPKLSAIFLQKIRSVTRSGRRFGRRAGGVSFMDAREKVPDCVLLRKDFRNGVLARSVTKISQILIIADFRVLQTCTNYKR
jgi:hypothetical protein